MSQRRAAPTTIGPYEVLKHLGSGGMANLYLARKKGPGGFERKVAVKVIKPQQQSEAVASVQRLLREARLVAQLHHRHIVNVIELGSEDDVYYLVMEYLEGHSLREVLSRLQ